MLDIHCHFCKGDPKFAWGGPQPWCPRCKRPDRQPTTRTITLIQIMYLAEHYFWQVPPSGCNDNYYCYLPVPEPFQATEPYVIDSDPYDNAANVDLYAYATSGRDRRVLADV